MGTDWRPSCPGWTTHTHHYNGNWLRSLWSFGGKSRISPFILPLDRYIQIGFKTTSQSILVCITKSFARFVVKTTQLVDFLIVPQIRNRIFVTSGYPILFLSSLYYESKFKARVIPTMLWITFPDRKKGPGAR